jgi:serine/threonine protein kinase
MSDRDTLRRVGRYEVLGELGRGGMAVVYLARQPDLDRFVALKELSTFYATDPAFLRRFVREARLAGSMAHPNVVTVFDSFEHEGLPYLSMEYVPRGALRSLIGQMTFPQIAGTLEAVLAGLSHAERNGIVHRDLKPENLLVTSDGGTKIADFGIAKAINELATSSGFATKTGAAIGTPAYMAPEQAKAEPVSAQTDLYATGIIAYELVAGRVPFGKRGDEPMSVMLKHVYEPVPAPEHVGDDVPAETLEWIERMLAKAPGDRFGSATEAWEELEEIVIGALGPRWRREARLVDVKGHEGRRPLTPPNFTSIPPGQSGYDTFTWPEAWRQPRADAPSVARTPTELEPAPTEPPQLSLPTEPIERPHRRRRWVAAVVGGTAVIGAAVLGVAVAREPDEPAPRRAATQSAGTADLGLSFTAPWRRGDGDTAKALGLDGGVTVERGSKPEAQLVAARTGASGPALLPAGLAKRLTRPAGGGERVRLGRYEAVRHQGLHVAGVPGTITLYGIPTSAGVTTIACVVPEGAEGAASDCDRVASSVRVLKGDAYPVAPRRAYGGGLNAALGALAPARREALDALRAARTPKDQAAAAGAAEQAYARTRRRLSGLDVSPIDAVAHRNILRAAARTADGYQKLQAAARAKRSTAFDDGRRLALSGEAAFAGAIAALGSLGYEVRS